MRPLSLLFLLLPVLAPAAEKIIFNRDIRPILSDKCFHCHGPDEKERKSGLRLDVRDEALRPAESGVAAIKPGDPKHSELISRCLTADKDDLMPPPKLGKPLTAREKELLQQWVAEGAEYQGHWAFIPPTRPAVPALKAGQQPIDAFITARLTKEGLQPSPEADRATLIRRASLDLVGLPPTPAEVATFESDASPNAYEKVVDRLLASEHYGERMAMQWLDFARYADSHGFQTDSSRSMWPWREWVIRTFNANKPFDQFTIEQIAGDLLPNATLEQKIATGFNRNHRINGEGGIIGEEWRIENVIDRVETTGFTWLALSLNCCRCHDHKYDPITQKEFYQLFSFFNNTTDRGTITGGSNRAGGNEPPLVTVTDAATEKKLASIQREIDQAKQQAAAARKDLAKLVAAWEPKALKNLSQTQNTWAPLQPTQVVSKLADKGAKLTRQSDGSYLASGPNPPKDTYVFDAPLPKDGVTAFLLECLPDPSLPNQSLGRYANGNFVLTDFDVFVQKPGGEPEKQKLARATADYSQKGYEIEKVLKRDGGKGWAIDGPTKRDPRRAMFVLQKPISSSDGTQLLLRLRHEAINGHNIGRFRLSATAAPAETLKLDGDTQLAAIKNVLEIPAAKRSAAQKGELEKFFLANVDSPIKRATDLAAVKQKALEAEQNKLPNVMVMEEMPQPRDAFILNRGEYDKPTVKVGMGLPAVFPPLPKGAPMNRLGLAKWLVDSSNPLTARVWVNRAWEKFFGYGLCKTTENLGSQAEYPVHPELLDWLATEFMRSGWDMKAMQKLMVMSQTYRQQSKVTPELVSKDPDNRLLARGPRFRLAGELVRDQALAVSGLLVPKIGGDSVRPYMPEGVWDETSKYGNLRGYKHDSGEGLYRRTMYTIWKRTAAPPTMLLFDSPSRELCTVKRSRTNTPLQALALLNEVTFVEAARALAERIIKEGGATPGARIDYAYRLVTARAPDADSKRILLAGLIQRLADFKTSPESATKLITTGESKPDSSLNPSELAAYTMTASVLLNLDRTITRD
ncbi:PSD1 and planctomycete cytochrome C domain-containing protein [Prosthecobacter sp.]|uniref:PSD1 and planctomycete cytochrome C domain-containing protein n=1 Tax=Prosthecobacter sp. TaxID=1965333 RepID=UPI001E081410|nr:PSD1 and planctomycete cytochrome C domain-containing protein [Prosthecobacter sp.]MCB1277366.1 PSD1 domain-containing protein [Prosthecobacter sp.]